MDRTQERKQRRAEQIYKDNLEDMLKHPNEFVVIDTNSRSYVFGHILTEAIIKYRNAGYPMSSVYFMRLDEKGEISPYLHKLGLYKLAS